MRLESLNDESEQQCHTHEGRLARLLRTRRVATLGERSSLTFSLDNDFLASTQAIATII